MNPVNKEKNRRTLYSVLIIIVGLIALQNQRLSVSDPEDTYPKRIKRAIRLLITPAENELQRHLIGKGIACEESEDLYRKVASATVVIQTDNSVGAGVFIAPRLIATAKHVVDGRNVRVLLPSVREQDLAQPGKSIPIASIHPVASLDLAFVTTQVPHRSWLKLERNLGRETSLMIVGHPGGKYYALQKARIKKKELLESSNYVVFKDNEIFFGNSGGGIFSCEGNLVGVVSMMSNYDNSMLKQGIGINAATLAQYAQKLG